MPQKMNNDRVRRHSARSTPDKIERRFDGIADNVQYDVESWLKRFAYQMSIKHPEPGWRIDILQDDDLAFYPMQLVYKVQARKLDWKD